MNGLRFFTPQLLLDGPRDIRQYGYINLTSEWEVFESVPSQYPDSFKELSQEEEELEIHKLRGQKVEKVEILSPWSHWLSTLKAANFYTCTARANNTNHGLPG
ncbi:hypothetical protein [Microbulbifer sp. JMSA003]|uniref:hypothetical protein n=1 Tax=Microbulbifer sp. JMSA003 TaxID=3243369 RepID=UPI00403901D0